MRKLILALALLAVACASSAQTVSSKIMDANISWTQSGSQYTGQLNVYLTDTVGITGLQIDLGTTPGGTDLLSTQYFLTGSGNLWNTGSIDTNHVLHIPLGSYSLDECYARVSILLGNNESNDISIHSSN